MKRLSWLGWIAFLGSALTGIAILILSLRSPGYFSIIRLHQIFGVALALLLPLALAWHLKQTSSGAWSTALALLCGGLLAVPVPTLMVLPEEEHSQGPLSYLLNSLEALLAGDLSQAQPAIAGLSLLALVGGATAITLIGLVSRLREREASRRTGLALTLLTAWALTSGLLLGLEGVKTLGPAQMFHSFAGSWVIAVVLVHLAAKRAAQTRAPRFLVALMGFFGLLAFSGGLFFWNRIERQDRDDIEARTPRDQEERQALASGDPSWKTIPKDHLIGARSCGVDGCHTQVTDEWLGSPHRFSATNAFYRAAVDALIERKGMEAAIACATCHDPARVLAGTVANAYKEGVPTEGFGVSCIVCHSITEPQDHPPKNGLFWVAVEEPYPGEGSERVAHIRMDTQRHQDVFVGNDAIYTNSVCRSCHRLELGEEHLVIQEADMAGADYEDSDNYCRGCHLTERGPIIYSHFMAGINADLAHYVPELNPKDQALVKRQSQRARAFAGLSRFLPINDDQWTKGRKAVDQGNTIGRFRLAAGINEEGLRLEFHTKKGDLGLPGGGHSFPSGPFDLQQVWIEIWIADAQGRVIHHSGSLSEDGRLQAPLVRLGARELNAEGEEIIHHRIDDIRSIKDKRVLKSRAPLNAIRDVVSLPLPNEPAFPLDVRARWLFRRANTDFSTWALGEGSSPMPTHELVGVRTEVRPFRGG